MKILHFCISCFYIDNALYQENELVREHVLMGHNVKVIASTETMAANGNFVYLHPSEYVGSEGALVKRIPYSKWLPQKIMRKLRFHPGVRAEIEAFKPDIIIFHGCCGWEILTVAAYARANPEVRFFIDSHEDRHNSALNFISRLFLHKLYFGPILRLAYKATENPILCISTETMEFVHEVYGIPFDRLEFYPLGGRPLSDEDYANRRAETRSQLGLKDSQVMVLVSGKLDWKKRLTESLRGFTSINDPDFRLFITGVIIDPDHAEEIERLITSDPRVKFLGWNDADTLIGLLAATDIYLQPGAQSVTMQNSICQRCVLIINNVKAHRPYVSGNGYLTEQGKDLASIFNEISSNKSAISSMQSASYHMALQMLDYRQLARRFF